MKKLMPAAALAIGSILVLAACAPTPAAPETTEDVIFPEEGATITMVVPFSAGGTTDITARALATVLSEELGANIEVLNTPGAGGQLGITELSTAEADGYTVGFTNLPSTIPTYVVAERGATYDRDSFVPLGAPARTSNYMAVAASSPYEDLDGLLEAADAAPGTITVGVASDDERLGVEAVAESADVEFNIVPFDGGPEKTTALLGGQVDAIVGGGGTVVPGVQNGDFRAVVILGTEPDAFLPEVPTLTDLGIDVDPAGFQLLSVLSAPTGVPDSIVAKYEAAIEAATSDPTFIELNEAGFKEAVFVNSADVSELWAQQEELFTEQLASE